MDPLAVNGNDANGAASLGYLGNVAATPDETFCRVIVARSAHRIPMKSIAGFSNDASW